MRAAHIAHDSNVYMVGGLVPPQAFNQADRIFTSSIRSFRALSTSEAENIRPHRVELYIVRAGDTWARTLKAKRPLHDRVPLQVLANELHVHVRTLRARGT